MKDKSPDVQNKMREFQKICRSNGLKLTHQRLQIFSELASSSEHPSAESIYKSLVSRYPSLSLDTVYRTLFRFEKLGILSKVQALDDRARFDGNPLPHHHMVCTKCKNIIDFYWPAFDDMQRPHETKKWGRVKSIQVELRGVCDSCLEAENNGT
jgi:Fur family transcriptional regulator, peroxide stress response regulator